jgi:glutathione peroxidase
LIGYFISDENLDDVRSTSFQLSDKTQNIKIDTNKTNSWKKQNIYQFKVEDLSGNTFDFST